MHQGHTEFKSLPQEKIVEQGRGSSYTLCSSDVDSEQKKLVTTVADNT